MPALYLSVSLILLIRFSTNLLNIINDLLDLAKIEAGKVELHLETVRIDELCDRFEAACKVGPVP